MSHKRIRCPKCEEYTDLGAFCDSCGFELAMASSDTSISDVLFEASDVSDDAETGTLHLSGSESSKEMPEGATHVESMDVLESPEDKLVLYDQNDRAGYRRIHKNISADCGSEDTRRDPNDCGDFRLLWNRSRCFQVGMYSAFDFRLQTMTEDAYEEVDEIELTLKSEFFKRDITRSLAAPRPGKSRDFSLNYKPSDAGYDVVIDVELSYRKHERVERYFAQIRHDFFPKDSSAEKVIEHLSIKLDGVCADKAGDNKISILDNFRHNPTRDVRDLFRSLKDEFLWTVVPLEALDCRNRESRGEGKFRFSKLEFKGIEFIPLSSILMQYNGSDILIYSAKETVFGRDRKRSQVVLRRFHPNGVMDEDGTMRLSGVHFRMDRNPRWFITDLSSNGLFLLDRKLQRNHPTPVEMDRQQKLAFVHSSGKSDKYSWTILPVASEPVGHPHGESNSANREFSLVFTRKDLTRESYLLLQGALELSVFDARLTGLFLFHYHDSFFLSRGCHVYPINYNSVYQFGDIELSFQNLRQHGVSY